MRKEQKKLKVGHSSKKQLSPKKRKLLYAKKKTSERRKKPASQSGLLDKLKSKTAGGIFTTHNAHEYKVSPQLLSYYVKKKQIKRLSHGVYAFPDDLSFDFHSILKEKLICVPQAVVGLESALKFYDLTDAAPDVVHLIVPVSNAPKRKLEDVQFYKMKDEIYKEHIRIIEGIPVSSPERIIIDLLRFGYPLSFVLSVLKESRKKKKAVHLGRIKKMAPLYRVQGKVSRLLEVL